MYTIRQLTGNLLIVSPIPLPEPKTASGLFIPNTKGKETVCEVIKIGNEVTNPMIKIGDLVTVDSELLKSAAELDRQYNFQKEKRKYYHIQQYGINAIVDVDVAEEQSEDPNVGNKV